MLLKRLAYLLILTSLLNSCNPDDNIEKSNNCDTTEANQKFDNIILGLDYPAIEEIMEEEGDNFRNDITGNSTIKYYKWIFCDNDSIRIETWILDDQILLAQKTFIDDSCSNKIDQENFSMITNEDNHDSVKSLLESEGDNFRNDFIYEPSIITTAHYKWIDCSDEEKFIEVWFQNDSPILIMKSF